MSSTQNEGGPFVVFILPAIVGGLTILLLRRWACAPITNPASRISRRRKFYKDPTYKRSLQQMPCKMVAAGTKKASGASKKATVNQVSDEDVSNVKRVRSRHSPAMSSISDAKFLENPPPPKHIPFPFIPHDGELLFEIMIFTFTLVAMGLQFLNLYRTMWWLPHSYTTQAMNFYLIDQHLVAFIVTILCRRLLLSLAVMLLKCILTTKMLPHAIKATRLFILGVLIGALLWCSYFIVLKHPFVKLFYLCYPAVIYFILFGMNSEPFLELHNRDIPLMHSCSHEPEQIRVEVEALRQDFNMRVKKILFNSIVGAYYTSLIPCCFAQPYLHYDVTAAAQQVGLVWGALCGRYTSQLLSASLMDTPHRATAHLGRWIFASVLPDHEPPEWSSERAWSAGAHVSWCGTLYVAAAPVVCAAPGDPGHTRFYSVFNNPSKLLCLLLCLQLSLVALQFFLIFSLIAWHNFVAIIILLFINYYTLFKMLRDYLIAWKVYKAENMLQDRNMPIQQN